MSQTISIYSWNVNGIRAAHKKGFLDWFNLQKPSIVCIQETKAQPEQIPEEINTIPGYQSWYASAVKKGYSGVGLISNVEPLSVVNGFGIERFDNEGRTLIATYDDFILFNVYFPNGKASEERLQYKMDFYDAFLNYLDNQIPPGKNVVICGDVNTAHHAIDLARPKENESISGFLPEERAWIDKLLEHGYVDTFRQFHDGPDKYTWWSFRSGARERNVGWRIDYFYVNAGFSSNVIAADIHPEIMGSDHCPISIQVAV